MRTFYKIIHTSSRASWGNREKRILSESLWMKENGHQIAVITPAGTPLFEKARQNGLMVYPISFKPLARIGEYGRLKEIFISEQPFVVNAHGRRDAKIALKAAQTAGVPLRIMSRHNGERIKHTWPNKKIYKTHCHYVFTTSKDSAGHLKQTFALSDMHVFSIPDGICPPAALPDRSDSRRMLARTLGLEPAPGLRFIGVFGKMDANTCEYLFNAAENLDQQFPNHYIVITDELYDQEKACLQKKEILNRIHVLPQTEENTTEHYPGLDCGIFFPTDMTFYQGVPVEITTAMAWGCPVISQDMPGFRDVVEDRKTGLLIDPDKPESLLDAISCTLNQPEETQARTQSARHLVEKHYSMDAMGRDVIRIYRLHQVKIERKFLGVS